MDTIRFFFSLFSRRNRGKALRAVARICVFSRNTPCRDREAASGGRKVVYRRAADERLGGGFELKGVYHERHRQ